MKTRTYSVAEAVGVWTAVALTFVAAGAVYWILTEDYTRADALFDASYAYFSSTSAGWLRHARVDWSRVTLFWADERAMPGDTNYAVAERLLLRPLGARGPRTHRMPIGPGSLDDAALFYDQLLAHELHEGPLDLAILGVGDDGAVSSIFPGHPYATDGDLRVVAVESAPRPPTRRLSLSRALTVRSYLISQGVRSTRIDVRALGARASDGPADRVDLLIGDR